LDGTVETSVLVAANGAMNAALGVCVAAAVALELVLELLVLPHPAAASATTVSKTGVVLGT
jgi:hypothetical protein